MRSYWTYILASRPRGTLYIGVTNGLIQRIDQHRAGAVSAVTRRYRVHTLVWFEEFARARAAIQREKSLKRYNRDWKINLIERTNPLSAFERNHVENSNTPRETDVHCLPSKTKMTMLDD
jgi:putative endonuclease